MDQKLRNRLPRMAGVEEGRRRYNLALDEVDLQMPMAILLLGHPLKGMA
jgi:hypothetical protein